MTGLTIGADDYVTKPFSLEEVVTRLRVILRRAGHSDDKQSARVTFADLELDDDTREVWKAGEPVSFCRPPSSRCSATSWSTPAPC